MNAQPAHEATPAPEADPVYVGKPAPAPRHDVLRGALYQPKPWNVPRSGAQDFQAAPSVGTPC